MRKVLNSCVACATNTTSLLPGDITDITGQVAQDLTAIIPKQLYMATLDLDRTYTHDDFVAGKYV